MSGFWDARGISHSVLNISYIVTLHTKSPRMLAPAAAQSRTCGPASVGSVTSNLVVLGRLLVTRQLQSHRTACHACDSPADSSGACRTRLCAAVAASASRRGPPTPCTNPAALRCS